MAVVVSQNSSEALEVVLGGFEYDHYSGRQELTLEYRLFNLAEPEQAFDVGRVYTGPDFAQSLRRFDFCQNPFHYAFNFNWENDSDNAGWWIRKKGKSLPIDLEFVFLRSFWWGENVEDEDRPALAADIDEYVDPIRAAQLHFPGLGLVLSSHEPGIRYGVLSCTRPSKATVSRIVASPDNESMLIESRAHITASTVEFQRFLNDLLQEINEAESQFAGAK
jgi:hypothetical protein